MVEAAFDGLIFSALKEIMAATGFAEAR